MLFGGWTALGRTVVVGVLAYVALVLLLRLSGKRTLSKFNAFDFVVTVAIGSTLATVLLSEQVALAQGVTAFTVLLTLQFVITWLSVRSARVRELVKGEPALLLHRGEYLSGALRRERITREELLAAAREQGVASLDDVESAVLETDGTITIVRSAPETQPSTLAGVRGFPAHRSPSDAS
jgi:uncharacterized membrane protein YcaP (DUF421 family)